MAEQDSGYKQLFSHAAMVRDLLLGFVREDWVRLLDFTTLEKVGGSQVTDDLRERHSDVIWRLRWGAEWLYIYLVLEFQATVDWTMPLRLDIYVKLLYQDLIRSGRVRPGEKLPPVLPLVLYNGREKWTAPLEVADLIAPAPAGLDRYRPRMQYLLIDTHRLGQADLAQDRNLAAALLRLECSRTPGDVRGVVRELIHWLRAPEQSSLRRAFAVWLGRVLLPRRLPGQRVPELADLQEVDTMLAETVLEWTKQWEAEGWAKGHAAGQQAGLREGRQEGRQEGEARLLLRQLRRRFGDLPAWVTDKVRTAPLSDLESWGDRIMDAGSLDEVFVTDLEGSQSH
ncbi:MAG: Rpn family recombination-promoting nuclease/putative transposase [Magnetococcales bacterium]|nr:Rpn family recombination-promoting nuclease/putative transposase [Magnetococcales bacterium]MBF0624820.1 Rpn family recombination-promoting nuclease/putative transposase [Magnetococcales bacterium]